MAFLEVIGLEFSGNWHIIPAYSPKRAVSPFSISISGFA